MQNACRIIKSMCNDTQRELNSEKKKKLKKSLASSWNVKEECGRERYLDQCNSNERTELPLYKLGL